MASGERILIRAAASSMARGIPWRRALIAATAGAFSLVTAKPGRTATARSMNSRTAPYASKVAGSTRSGSAAGVQALEAGHRARVGRGRQARDRILLLARDVEDGPAGDDDLDRRGAAQELGDHRRRGEDLLEVVEDEQQALVGEPFGEGVVDRACRALGDADRARDPRRDEHRVADRLERDEEHAVGEVVRGAGGQLQRQPGLARPARAGQRQETGRGQQAGRLVQLRVPTDERRELGRQVVRVRIERPEGREGGRQPVTLDLEDADGRAQVLEAVLPEVPERDAGDRSVLEQVVGDAGHQDLAAMGDRRRSGRPD